MSGAARATLLAAVIANVLGWVLPAFSEERGFEAFVFALSPLWDYRHFQNEGLGLLAFIVLSALTNVLFVALAAVLAFGQGRRAKPVLWAAAAATLLNLYWPILLEAASWLNQGKADRPVKVTVTARSYESAQATASDIVRWLSPQLAGDPSRVKGEVLVQADSPEGGTVVIAN